MAKSCYGIECSTCQKAYCYFFGIVMLQNPELRHKKGEFVHPLRQITTNPMKKGGYGFNKTTLSERKGYKGVVCDACSDITCCHAGKTVNFLPSRKLLLPLQICTLSRSHFVLACMLLHEPVLDNVRSGSLISAIAHGKIADASVHYCFIVYLSSLARSKGSAWLVHEQTSVSKHETMT